MTHWLWPRRQTSPVAKQVPDQHSDKPSRWIDALHVFVLAGFGLAQPLYDRLGERAAFFMDQGIGLSVAYLMVLLISFVIPLTIVLFESVLGRFGRRGYEITHGIVVSLLLLLLALPVCKLSGILTGIGVVVAAGCLAAAVTYLYLKFRAIRATVTLASPGIILFPVVFLISFSAHFKQVDPTIRLTERWAPVPVVILVCDEFCGSSLMTPDREIDAGRFPNFAALARDATWFRNATTVHPFTLQAVPAILSGRYPTTSINPVHADRPQNLFSVLEATDVYEMTSFEPVTSLGLESLKKHDDQPTSLWSQTTVVTNSLWRVYLFHLTPVDFQEHLPRIPSLWFGLHDHSHVDALRRQGLMKYGLGEPRNLQFEHFLDCLEPTTKPTLHFMHVLLPHMAWCYLPSGRRYAEDEDNRDLLGMDPHQGTGSRAWGRDELETVHNQQRYLLQIRYVDQLIGLLVERLKTTGMYDRCLLIVTADHGISFRSGQPGRYLVPGNQDEILSIPLFIKRPGQTKGGMSDQEVESVDVLPTVADVVGIEMLGRTDGSSVFDKSRPGRTFKTFVNGGQFTSISTVAPAIIRNSPIPRDIRQRFGDSSDPANFYRIGPIPELVGRKLDSLTITAAAPTEIELVRFGDEPDDTATVQVPCFFEGLIRPPHASSDPTVIAVAINGTIQAVTRTYLHTGANRHWSAMVPEASFHAGRNDVLYFTVSGIGPDWQLRPCRTVQ